MSALITKICDLLYLYSFYRANGHSRRRSLKISLSLIQEVTNQKEKHHE